LAEKGYFPLEELQTFRQLNSRLQGHPDMNKTPGVDMTTGSLGQGFASTVGMALGLRKKGSASRVYALLGDGELNEGIIWESAMIAANYQTDNLTAIVDKNGKQACGYTKDIMNMDNLADKWEAFGWNVISVDGHHFQQILTGFQQARDCKGKPSVMIARTIKGKGVSFMENGNEFYGEKLSKQDIQLAKQELLIKGE
jgi:transketolase